MKNSTEEMKEDIKNIISLSTAGGGKTTKLIKRVEEILKKSANESRILIVSFTNSSCEDIFKRCGIKAITLHSFCYNFLPSKYSIEEDSSRFTNIFLPNFFNLSKLGEQTINQLINYYYIYKKLPEEIPLSPNDKILNQEFKELINLIDEEKNNHNCLFFSDIINKFQDNLNDFLYTISLQYDHFLIDETQDLSEVQLQIVYKIV
ncbi:MAG: UvrD-helicase domain-containing protein, partial [Bacteroidota bacterium]